MAICIPIRLAITIIPLPPRETALTQSKLCEGPCTAASCKTLLWENAPDNGEMAKNTWYYLLPLLGNRILDPVPMRWQQSWHSHAAQLSCSTTCCWWARGSLRMPMQTSDEGLEGVLFLSFRQVLISLINCFLFPYFRQPLLWLSQ